MSSKSINSPAPAINNDPQDFFWHLLSARIFQILSQSLKRIAPWNRPSYVDFSVCCPEADERRHMCVSFIPGSSSISKSGNIQHLYQRIQPCVVYEIYLLSIGASRTVLFFRSSSTLYMWSHLSNLCSNRVAKKKLWIESLLRSERHEKTDQDWSGSIFFLEPLPPFTEFPTKVYHWFIHRILNYVLNELDFHMHMQIGCFCSNPS